MIENLVSHGVSEFLSCSTWSVLVCFAQPLWTWESWCEVIEDSYTTTKEITRWLDAATLWWCWCGRVIPTACNPLSLDEADVSHFSHRYMPLISATPKYNTPLQVVYTSDTKTISCSNTSINHHIYSQELVTCLYNFHPLAKVSSRQQAFFCSLVRSP